MIATAFTAFTSARVGGRGATAAPTAYNLRLEVSVVVEAAPVGVPLIRAGIGMGYVVSGGRECEEERCAQGVSRVRDAALHQ